MQKSLYFITALLVFIYSSFSVAAIDAFNFESPQQEKDYQLLTQQLRCPQCQNNSIADSNSAISVDMRAKVLELLQSGKSKDDVVLYMVERYGNFVTYDPPITIATSLLWITPISLILFGLFFILRHQSTSKKKSAVGFNEENLTEHQKVRLNELLNTKENNQ